MTNHITCFKGYRWSVTAYVTHSHTVDSKACSCVASLSPNDKSTWNFTKIGNWKKELTDKCESIAKKWKVVTLEMKFDSNIQEVIETIVDSGNLDTDAVRGT